MSTRSGLLRIRVHYPASNLPEKTVLQLRGDALGLSWERGMPMERREGDLDVWEASLDTSPANPASPSTFIRFKVLAGDDTWQRGPDNLVEVPARSGDFGIDVFPWFFTESGRLETLGDIFSPQLRNARGVTVYLPPSFDENPLKVHRNVIVMPDGQNLFDDSTSFSGVAWKCDETIDRLLHEGEMAEVVLIGVNNSDDRLNELAPFFDFSFQAGGLLGCFLDFVEQTVIPRVCETFAGRIEIDRCSLGMMGSSLGGLAAFYAVWTRSKVWGLCGCISGAFEWGGHTLLHQTMASTRPLFPIKVYLDSGDRGVGQDAMRETMDVREWLERQLGMIPNVNLFYHLAEGAEHTEEAWQNRFHIPCTKLFPPAWVHPRAI